MELGGPWEAFSFENLSEMTQKAQESRENNSYLIKHLFTVLTTLRHTFPLKKVSRVRVSLIYAAAI